jgi:alcohol dehydrogenase class IV
MRFEFATATRVLFGEGVLKEAGPIARSFGQRALIVTGRNGQRAQPLVAHLSAAGVSSLLFPIAGEPSLEAVVAGTTQARNEECDIIIAFGGGSAIDGAKAVAALLTNRGDLLDYVEVIGGGKPITKVPAPFVAIPTTSGTGSEVTRNAVLTSQQHKVKASLRSPLLLPRVALVDPDLTVDLPADVRATTSLDALSQLIEAFVCIKANPMTDALCRDGIRRSASALRRFARGECDADARTNLALASLFSGMALANAGLGAVHGFAAPLGGMFHAPHGALCAVLLPQVMRTNIAALRERQPNADALARYEEIASLLTGERQASAEEGIAWITRLTRDLGIPRLSHFGVTDANVPAICENAAKASSMKGNPLPLTSEELSEILRAVI